MYVAITPQQLGSSYSSSVADYVAYLEKENEERALDSQEHFFNQYNDRIDPETVIKEIDGNTAKLKKKEPKFYSIIVSPSQRELLHIQNSSEYLKQYTRELMKEYAKSFHRDRTVTVNDIKYYAKIEHERTFRGFEKQILENAPYRKQIVKLENDLRKVERGELIGNTKQIELEIEKLMKEAPHKINGQMVVAGMKKEGLQTHIHIIVSRTDASNTYSLSPGSKYKASEAELNGKMVKRGFDRNSFYEAAEKTFDSTTGYQRNYVETYTVRKQFVKDPKRFYSQLMGLPINERTVAFKLMHKTGIHFPMIPTNNAQLAVATFKRLKRGLEVAIRSSSIGY